MLTELFGCYRVSAVKKVLTAEEIKARKKARMESVGKMTKAELTDRSLVKALCPYVASGQLWRATLEEAYMLVSHCW